MLIVANLILSQLDPYGPRSAWPLARPLGGNGHGHGRGPDHRGSRGADGTRAVGFLPGRSQVLDSEFALGPSLMPSRALISTSRYLRWPPGVRILLIRPDAAHRVTVFGSTRKRAATSPGVSRRSLWPSIRCSSNMLGPPQLSPRGSPHHSVINIDTILVRFRKNLLTNLVGSL